MSNEYQRITDSLLKSLEFPLRADFFLANRSFLTSTICFPEQIDERAVAIRLLEIPFKEKLAIDASNKTIASYAAAKAILDYLEETGHLKVDHQPSKSWLDTKLNQLQILDKYDRTQIRNWFENPASFPEVSPRLLTANEILTVKAVPGGRVVVSPRGHTLAYSMAKRIYLQMIGKVVEVPVPEYVSAYENDQGRSLRGWRQRFPVSILRNVVKIGCQTIPRQAILDLAQRENW